VHIRTGKSIVVHLNVYNFEKNKIESWYCWSVPYQKKRKKGGRLLFKLTNVSFIFTYLATY
jgi:hypothetical protein